MKTSAETGAAPAIHLRWVMILVTGALFMEILDGAIIVTALPAMARDFAVAPSALDLGISAYMLAVGVFIPVSGWVADRFGARNVLAAAIVLFTLASALCSMAQGVGEFVALRIVQGVAGAMMVPVGRLVIMHHTPKERLMAAISSLIWPALIAPVLGPPLGGLITLHLGWRWIFYMNLPLGLVALVATLVLVPGTRDDDQRPFDWTGFALCGTATFALLLGLDRLVMQPDTLSAGLIAAGFGLGWATLRHFGRADHPMIGLKPWAIPTFRVSQSGGSLARMAIGSAPFLLPLMFQVGFGYDAFHSGLLVLAVFAGNLGMKSVTTPILRRFGYRQVMVWNGVINALLLGACALLTPTTPAALVVAVLFASGCARSMQFTAIGTVTLADVPKAQMADANGLSNTLGQIAQAAGITLAALCIHAGGALAHAAQWPAAGGDYRIAFVLVAVVALVSVRDAAALPRDAADHFISRRA